MKKHAAKWLVPFLKYGVGFGLLGYVIYKYWGPQDGGPGVGQLLRGTIAFEWLALAGLLMATAAALQIYRWYLLVRALDLPIAVRDAYRLSFVGIFYNTFFPGSVGGDLLKAIFIARAHPERKTRAVASVIADRALGLFGLILFVAATGSIAWAAGDPRINGNADLQRIVRIMAIIAGVSVAGFVLLGFVLHREEKFAGRLRHIPKLGNSLAEAWFAVCEYRRRPKVVVLGVLLSAVSHFALVFALHSASRVFPPDNPDEVATVSEHMVIAPIGFIAQALPVSPGGVGVGEAVFAWLYKLCDRPESRGMIARLSLRLVEWLIGLSGYLVYLRMRAEVKELEHEAEEDEEKASEGGSQPTAVG